MKFNDLKEMTTGELTKKQRQLSEEMFELKMKHSMGQVANPLQIRAARKDQARVYTALNMKLKK
jgi:large subunit ribosomal protein L29